jgi:hypothetical protein
MQPSDNDHEFRLLKKLLALKRHENPPPGYFENFSGKVTARLRAAEEARPDGSYWQWLARGLEWRTALVGLYAVSFIGLVTWGIYFGMKTGNENVASQPPPATATPVMVTGTGGNAGKDADQKTMIVASNANAPDFLFAPPSLQTAPTGFQPEKK